MPKTRKKVEALDDRFLSLPRAAQEIGISRHGVLAAIARKELESDFVAGHMVVTKSSAAELKRKLAA